MIDPVPCTNATASEDEISALRDLRLGVEMDKHNMVDGDVKLRALDAAIEVLSKQQTPVANLTGAADHYSEVRTVLQNAQRILGSSSRAITMALVHLDALYAALASLQQKDAQIAALESKLRATEASTPVAREAQTAASTEHYDEVKATLQGLHRMMERLSAIERRVGPIGSHARGYTHKITNALRHLDALNAALVSAPVAGRAQTVGYYTDWPGERQYAREPHEFDEPGLYLTFTPDTPASDYWHPCYATPQASEAVRDALVAFDAAMNLCDDFPELQHHRDALRFAVQKARAALSAQPGAQKDS